MNAGIIDNNRFGPYGEPISPVAKNSRLTNSPWGYTGESHDIEGGLVYLRARYYEPNTGRFIQQDSYPYFGDTKNPVSRNLYIYGNGNPLMYTDPSGHVAILPLILKAGVNGAVDLLAQAAINFFFNPETKNNVSASFAKVNWWQVGRSTLEGAVPWKVPGGKYGKAAITAAGDVTTNLLHQGNKYSAKQALTDFMVGFLSDLGGSALNDLIKKYGKKSVDNVLDVLFDWKLIKGTQAVIEGTNVPKSFVINALKVNGKEVWVGGNATKHIAEFVTSANKAGGGLLAESEIMNSFINAAKLASKQTLKAGDNRIFVGGWEIGINGTTGVIYHALMK